MLPGSLPSLPSSILTYILGPGTLMYLEGLVCFLSFSLKKKNLIIYWVLVATCGPRYPTQWKWTSRLTLCDPMDCSLPGSSVHAILQARILLQGIFPTQRSNPGLPRYRQILYHLSHQGSPANPGPLHWELRVLATGPQGGPSFSTFLSLIIAGFFTGFDSWLGN